MPDELLEDQFTSSIHFEIVWNCMRFEICLELAFFGLMEYFGWGLVLNGYERPQSRSPRQRTRGLLPVVLENQVKSWKKKRLQIHLQAG